MRQLYKQCPNIHIDYWAVHTKLFIREDSLEAVVEYLAPRTRRLHIGFKLYHIGVPPWIIKNLLSHCSSTLEELTLEAGIERNEQELECNQVDPRPWVQLKRLNLLEYPRNRGSPYPAAFWEWLWSRCGAVEQLIVECVPYIRQSLVEGIVTHMPKLNKIRIRKCYDEDTEAILSTTRQGWKEVALREGSTYPQFTTHLLKHSDALERLMFHEVYGPTDKDRVQLLACCSNLRDFSDTHPVSPDGRLTQGFNAKSFIDQDHGSLKPWMCETSLRILRIRLSGIPRPDVREENVNEDYPGHGRVIQKQVYDRLARFTNLETLWLGGSSGLKAYSCLEISLESGLDRISGLKKLKKLNVSHMETRIGEQEVKWMVEQWPELRVVYGLSCKMLSVQHLHPFQLGTHALHSKTKIHPNACVELCSCHFSFD